MIIKTVKFNSGEDVRVFCNKTMCQDFEMDLIRGRYVIDAKSIMGIFSLSLDSPINLHIYVDSESECQDFLKGIDAFLCK